MPETLLRTKLHPPGIRQELVARPRLHARISEGLHYPLTLITAPAGFGKTTLVASCIKHAGLPVVWLSLDRNDNQPERFLTYLLAAVQEADQAIGKEASEIMAVSQQTLPELVLTSLINSLDVAAGDIALVLDDYQLINNSTVHQAVAFLLDHCPRTFHLIIASRSDPPLPLARLRARGQIVELRAADLRFSEDEAAQFLNEMMGLELDAGSISALEARTEGWIAGLQMAALSLRNRIDVHGFIAGFSGTNRYILDYLLEEVLASQPAEIQRFLLNTSVLERLTASLCDAVLSADAEAGRKPLAGRKPDAAVSDSKSPAVSQSADMLAYLERQNLFLVPLDDRRIWYRYHQLFADLLRGQLQSALGERGTAQLHTRAAEWHGQNGSILEAIHHASMASDDEMLERFIKQNYLQLVRRGEQSWIRSWTDKLSDELVYNRPWLCIYEAYSYSWFGDLDRADRLLEEAEKRMPAKLADAETHAMQGLLAYVKSRVTAMRGDLPRAIALCLKAREHVPDDHPALQLDTLITLGYEYFLHGDYASAEPILSKTIQSGVGAGAVINTVAAACILARLYAVQGKLNRSFATYQIAAQSIPQDASHHLGARALVEIGMAEVFYERNDLDAAQLHINRGLDMLPWWGKADDLVLAQLTLARIHLAQADLSGAAKALEKSVRIIQTSGVFSEARHAVQVGQVKLWLSQGDLQAAVRWAASEEERLIADHLPGYEAEITQLARARVHIAKNEYQAAIKLLLSLEENTRSAGRMGRVLEIQLLKARAKHESGNVDGALLALTECLAQAEPEGYARLFLDEGEPIQMLLAQWMAHAGSGTLRDYAAHLLSQFDAEQLRPKVEVTEHSKAGELVDPLSPRELEVLHLLALGKTNQEIASQLVVAVGTVKAHTANIYRKLDVANRTEAAARARMLGILH